MRAITVYTSWTKLKTSSHVNSPHTGSMSLVPTCMTSTVRTRVRVRVRIRVRVRVRVRVKG